LALLAVPASAATVTVHTNEGDDFHLQGGLFDTSVHDRRNLLTAFIGIPWGSAYGFPIGVGGLFYIPLVKEGFIPTLNEEFGLEFGASVNISTGYGFGIGFGVEIPVRVLWAFHLTPDWSVYATAGIQVHLWWVNYGLGSAFTGWPVYPEFAVGSFWHLSPGWTLRFELGWGLRVGLTWPI
jgi:hypothetical protein